MPNPFDHVLQQFANDLGGNGEARLLFLTMQDAYNVLAAENPSHPSLASVYTDPYAEVLRRLQPFKDLTTAYRSLEQKLTPYVKADTVVLS